MDVSRRNFFQVGTKKVLDSLLSGIRELSTQGAEEEEEEEENAEATKEEPRFLRPPGALEEAGFLETCTRCDECIKACPKWAIRRAGVELGPEIDGTPIILPETNPCWLCKDLPCIAACEPGALRPLTSPEEARMGLAVVDLGLCYSASGSICEACQEGCPVRPVAILAARGATPEVETGRCTGCGVCAYLCPPDAIQINRLS